MGQVMGLEFLAGEKPQEEDQRDCVESWLGWENISSDSWLKQWSDIDDHCIQKLAGRETGIYSSLKKAAAFKTGRKAMDRE